MEYSREDLEDLYGGRLGWEQVKSIMSQPKDDDRFDKYIEILQERVPWAERILLPVSEHLFVVEKGGERIVKCDCGHEFGDYRINWKLNSLIFVRDNRAKLEEIYPGVKCPDPNLCEVREYYCPGCAALLKVESVPVGYPVIFDFLPDIDAFYRDWLGRPLENEKEMKDMSFDLIRQWCENPD
ncbi:MAG: acetone carboxylase subunit gamma [Dehalococcoidia bacterium]